MARTIKVTQAQKAAAKFLVERSAKSGQIAAGAAIQKIALASMTTGKGRRKGQ